MQIQCPGLLLSLCLWHIAPHSTTHILLPLKVTHAGLSLIKSTTPTPPHPHPHTHVCYSLFQVVQKPFPVCTSFPNLLANNSSKEGGFSMKVEARHGGYNSILPTHAHTHSSNVCLSLLSIRCAAAIDNPPH